MDIATIVSNVLTSGAIVTATHHLIKGLKDRLKAVEAVVDQQKDYISELRGDFKELSSLKSDFIREFGKLHTDYKDHAMKTYNDIIDMKDLEIAQLKQKKFVKFKGDFLQPTPTDTTVQNMEKKH